MIKRNIVVNSILISIVLLATGCGDSSSDTAEAFPLLPGEEFDVADFRGSVVVVDFFGTY